MDLHCLQAVEHPHNLHHLSTHSWSRPRRAASLHLRATLNRATAQHLSLVSNIRPTHSLRFGADLTHLKILRRIKFFKLCEPDIDHYNSYCLYLLVAAFIHSH